MSRLAIIGASGHGKVIADTASLDAKWKMISFFDDAWPKIPNDYPWPVVGKTEDLIATIHQFSGIVIGIGDNYVRKQKHEFLLRHNAPLVTIIHPQSYVSKHATIGAGCVVFAHAVVNIHAQVGLSSIVNTGASVDHDCRLGDFTHISPGALLAGGVNLGECSWVGIGSAVREGLFIGSNVIIGAGSAVVRSISDGQTVAGVPAKIL